MSGSLITRAEKAGFRPRWDDVLRRFEGSEPWEAMLHAVNFANRHGFSVGPAARGAPRAIKRGNHTVKHWVLLSEDEIWDLDGAIISHSYEFGPVVVRIRRRSADITLLNAS